MSLVSNALQQVSSSANVGSNSTAPFVSQAVGTLHSNPFGLSEDFRNSDAFRYNEYINSKEVAAAQKQMRFQEEQSAKAAAFNSAEAEKNRKWQEYMSNTAHQREVSDYIAAGLNPVLGIIGSNGATTPSGASASISVPQGSKSDTDASAMQVLATEVGKLLDRQTQTQLQTEQLKTQMDIAEMQNKMSEFLGLLSSQTTLGATSMSANASKIVAGITAAANKYIADITQGGAMDRLLKELDWKQENPQTIAALIPYIINSIFPEGWSGTAGSGKVVDGVSQTGIRRGISGLYDLLANIAGPSGQKGSVADFLWSLGTNAH